MISSDYSATLEPQPRSSPKVMPPRQNGLTRSPERPKVTKWSNGIAFVPQVRNFSETTPEVEVQILPPQLIAGMRPLNNFERLLSLCPEPLQDWATVSGSVMELRAGRRELHRSQATTSLAATSRNNCTIGARATMIEAK